MKISSLSALIVLAAATMMAGCATSSSGQPQTRAASTNAAVSSAGPDQASPYSQPLMATGGDLVMLRIVSRGIAG